MKEALGLIETIGLVAAIEAADTAVKAADVTLLGYEMTRGSGKIAVKILGDVGAVKAAVTAAVVAASRINEVYAYHVIPRPHGEIGSLIMNVDRGRGWGNGEPEGGGTTPPEPVVPAPAAEEPAPAEPEPALEPEPEPEPVEPVAGAIPEPPVEEEEAVAAAEFAAPGFEPEALPVEEVAVPEPEADGPSAVAMPATAQRCAAATLAGTRCRNRVMPGSTYCRVHQPKESEAGGEEEA